MNAHDVLIRVCLVVYIAFSCFIIALPLFFTHGDAPCSTGSSCGCEWGVTVSALIEDETLRAVFGGLSVGPLLAVWTFSTPALMDQQNVILSYLLLILLTLFTLSWVGFLAFSACTELPHAISVYLAASTGVILYAVVVAHSTHQVPRVSRARVLHTEEVSFSLVLVSLMCFCAFVVSGLAYNAGANVPVFLPWLFESLGLVMGLALPFHHLGVWSR